MKPTKMIMQRGARIPLAILVICLCLGSLVAVPVVSAFSPAMLEISEVDVENNEPADQTEFDEEFLLETIVGIVIVELIISKSRAMNLGFQAACLAPVFPPPKSI